MNDTLPDIDPIWDYSAPSKTEEKFRELLPRAKASNKPNYHLELLSQIARSQGLQGSFEEGHRTLDEAEKLLEHGMDRAKVRILLERGRLFNSNKEQEKSLPLFKEAMRLAEEAGEEFLAVDAAHMLGIAAAEGDRLSWNLKALEMAEAAKDERAQGWQGSLYNNIGYFFMEAGEYEKAMDMFEKLLAYTTARGDEEFADIARWFIAKIHRLQGKLTEALEEQLVLLKKAETSGSPGAYTLEELGEITLALGRDDERREYFKRAYKAFHSDEQYAYEVKFEGERLARIKELSQ